MVFQPAVISRLIFVGFLFSWVLFLHSQEDYYGVKNRLQTLTARHRWGFQKYFSGKVLLGLVGAGCVWHLALLKILHHLRLPLEIWLLSVTTVEMSPTSLGTQVWLLNWVTIRNNPLITETLSLASRVYALTACCLPRRCSCLQLLCLYLRSTWRILRVWIFSRTLKWILERRSKESIVAMDLKVNIHTLVLVFFCHYSEDPQLILILLQNSFKSFPVLAIRNVQYQLAKLRTWR